MTSPIPTIITHGGISVVRDDLFPGGTKARFIPLLFEGVDELVYASPQEGGAQTALATVGDALNKRVTIFVAKRKTPHPRIQMVRRLGGTIHEIPVGYLSVVQARARDYVGATRGSALVPFGVNLSYAVETIASAARSLAIAPDEIWCAAGSGVLARALSAAWPHAKQCVVQVGRELSQKDVPGATIHISRLKFGEACKNKPPFPSDPHYDAKAWEVCSKHHGSGNVVFWNVTGPATP